MTTPKAHIRNRIRLQNMVGHMQGYRHGADQDDVEREEYSGVVDGEARMLFTYRVKSRVRKRGHDGVREHWRRVLT